MAHPEIACLDMSNPVPIPQPPTLPIIGNVHEINPGDSMSSLERLGDTYGEIFKLSLGGVERTFVCSQRLLNELCDEKRFQKNVQGALKELRNGIHDGLFTAYADEPNWGAAHRVLMPAFGPVSIRGMFDEMHDIASQLVIKWARFGPDEKINVTEDFTRLTLDSIALCAIDTRFNSFYKDTLHPFVGAMVGLLKESGLRAVRPGIATYMMRSKQHQYDADIATLRRVAVEGVERRRAHPSDKKDLLNAMLNGKDPQTGLGLTEDTIINNMITFLIAGHETTSGMLSFLFYFLLKNPAAYQTAQKEVDDVIGDEAVTVDHMSKLPYLTACIREALRLKATAPAFSLGPKPDINEDPILIGGGKYKLEKNAYLSIVLPKVHTDPAVYGDDAAAFKPERMLDEPFSKLPPNSWKPFGNGMRGCIGRPFAWQEAMLTIALLLQNFNFRFDDPSYQLQVLQTLTIKPKGFFMHATLREHIDPLHLEQRLVGEVPEGLAARKRSAQPPSDAMPSADAKNPITVLYGSNSGTCEALSQAIARTAAGRGFKADVRPLDSATGAIPKDQPVILISASYEGQPPDNAAHFVEWLTTSEGKLDGVQYAVYGCGNHDWAQTFHKIPKLIDSSLEERGAIRLASAGLGDVGVGDIFNDFDKWQDEVFWPKISNSKEFEEGETGVELEIDTTSRRSALRQDVTEAIVTGNELLTAKGEPEKRHVTLKLPSEMTYKVGDYLAVLPMNNSQNIGRVLKYYGLPWDALLTIKHCANTTLPSGSPISAINLLGAYVELAQPATRKNISKMAFTAQGDLKAKLEKLAGEDFEAEVLAKRRSPLDLIEDFPDAKLPFSEFLAMLPPMRVRQYSISSSPLADPETATLTYSVLDTPSKSSDGKRYLGVASNYLSHVGAGDRVQIAVKPSHGNFHLPMDIEMTPIIMICAGTGLAPFRAFVQERAMQIAAGRELAPAYLFIGCSAPGVDTLFEAELQQWQKEGAVKLYYAYSKAKEQSEGCRYVQDRLWAERAEMDRVFADGAKLYVCGSNMVGEGVAAAVKRMYAEAAEEAGKPKSDEEVEEWFNSIKRDRYSSDVFA